MHNAYLQTKLMEARVEDLHRAAAASRLRAQVGPTERKPRIWATRPLSVLQPSLFRRIAVRTEF